jgi:hypothetical protein
MSGIYSNKRAGLFKSVSSLLQGMDDPQPRRNVITTNIGDSGEKVNTRAKENKKSFGSAAADSFVDLGDAPEAAGSPRPLSQPEPVRLVKVVRHPQK